MTEEVKKETSKTKLPGLPPLAAFIYYGICRSGQFGIGYHTA